MLPKIFGRLLAGGIAALLLCSPAAANVVVDDFQDGDNKNVYEQYWYTYSTYKTGMTLTPLTTPTVPLVPVEEIAGSSNYVAEMTYVGLDGTGNGTGANDYPEIGIGVGLTAGDDVGFGSEMNNADSIAFLVRGTSGVTFFFGVHTVDNASGNDDKYGKQFTISGTGWNRFAVALKSGANDLKQGNFGTAFPFSKARVTKISWAIKKSENKSVSISGAFAIDDITLIGSVTPPAAPPTPPAANDLCGDCVSATFGPATPNALLTDFSGSINELGYYGYIYQNDSSIVDRGSDGREGDGSSIDFTVKGPASAGLYAGIGINLSDNNVTVPLDASDFTGIYFEYKTKTGMDKIKFEVVEKAAANSGEYFYINLPGTNGVWKSAVVDFSKLVFPSWATPKRTALDKTSLAKLQFSYASAGSGSIAIDNIYFLGADKFPGQDVDPPDVIYVKITGIPSPSDGGSVHVSNNSGSFTITATPNAGYRFVKWAEDGLTNPVRTATLPPPTRPTTEVTFTALFEPIVITYKAGPGGSLSVDGGDRVSEYKDTLIKREQGPHTVTAWGNLDPPYVFKGWSDGSKEASRSDVRALRDTTFTAEFEAYVAPPTVVRVTYTASEGGGVGIIAKNQFPYSISVHVTVNEQNVVIARGTGSPMCVDSLLPGDSITVTAWPDSGDINYTFIGWSDGVTTATRVDKYEGGDINVTAFFINNDVIPPETPYAVFAYSAGSGGKLKADNDDLAASVTRSVVIDSAGPTVTAVPDDGYKFVRWSDGVTTEVRADTAKAAMNGTLMVEAEFALINVSSQTFKLLYFAGSGGKLIVGSGANGVASYDTTVVIGTDASAVTAKPDSGYIFAQWSDGSTQNPRFNLSVTANVSVTAAFRKQTSVATPSREIPKAPTAEITAVAPIIVNANGFTAGPNPTAAAVKFFITGRTIKTGKLSIYDASGNLVKTIKLSDNGSNGRRTVGSWNLKDSRGRQVAIGSYAVKGTVMAKNGVKEKVSTVIAVVK
jgi:hypothetical protein